MRQRKLRGRFLACASAGLLAAGLVVSSAGPASAATTVSISAPTVVLSNQQVWIQGAVSGSSNGATVHILKYANGAWAKFAQGTVTASRKYAVKVTIAAGGNAFRARASKPGLDTGFSKSVKVYGTTHRGIVLFKTNEYRKKQGRPALKGLSSLNQIAQDWSEELANNPAVNDSYFPHHEKPHASENYYDLYQGSWKFAAENIAGGATPYNVVAKWIDSSGHRANLLCDCTHIGIGYVNKPGSHYGTYFTQNFAKY